MPSLTVFVISCGEESLTHCLSAIENQKLSEDLTIQLQVIRNVFPMSEAFNEMHRRSKTTYFVQVDADMILKENALQTLYDGVRKSPPWVYAVYGQLYEEGFGVGGTVRCWKKNFFRIFWFRDRRTVDRDLFGRAKFFGLRRRNLNCVLGNHRPRHSVFSEYLKTKSDVEKWRFLGRKVDLYAKPLFETLLLKPDENRFRLFGAILGSMTPKDRVMRSKNIFIEKEELKKTLSDLGYEKLEDLKLQTTRFEASAVLADFERNYSSLNSPLDSLHGQVANIFVNS